MTLARIAARSEEERQRRQRVEVLGAACLGEIAVEHDIRGLGQAALEQVHQQEGEIVKHVAGRDDVAELDGVEQHRFAVDQHDVAEMKVAVDAADQAAAAAVAQQRHDALVGGAARFPERVDFGGRKNFRVFLERLSVFVDIGADRFDPRLRLGSLRCMGCGDGAAERIGERVVDFPCQMIERARLIEAVHLDRPFDRRAVPADREVAVASRVMATTPR